ncbi:MAG: ankyrin repeat domain-containing protein [Polyangia bacterium]
MKRLLAALLATAAIGCGSAAPLGSQDASKVAPRPDQPGQGVLMDALIDAIRRGDQPEVERLLEAGADADGTGTDGVPPLFVSAATDNLIAAETLLDRGARPDRGTDQGQTPLMIAAFAGAERIAALLLEEGADPSLADAEGATALMLAALQGDAGTVELLLDAGAKVNAVDSEGRTALMAAVTAGRLEATRALLDRGADVNVASNHGHTALMLAAGRDGAATVFTLLKTGAELNAVDEDGESAIVWAARAGARDAASILIQEAEQVRGAGRALTEACLAGYIEVVEILLDAGVEIESRGRAGWTCLMLACWEGRSATAELALERGADPAAADHTGWTALMTAASAGSLESGELLLEKGADPRREDDGGRTALSVAETNGRVAISAALREAAGLKPKPVEPLDRDVDPSRPLECPEPAAADDNPVAGMTPIAWHPADAPRRWGWQWERFGRVRSSPQVPVEVCRARGQCEWLLELTCEDGSNPFQGLEDAHAHRVGSVGPGGRCGRIVDLYVVPCPEKDYEIYMDMYHCSPLDE